MSMTNGAPAAVQNTDLLSAHPSRQLHKVANVYIRLMFTRIGEIDTLNEKYQAQASIEARWTVEFEKLSPYLSSDDQKHLINGKSVSLVKYNESHWHPQLFIENALGDLKEQIKYSAKKSKDDNHIYVCEHRDIKGSFWEKLELQHFPADVQDLSISVATMLYDDRVLLVADPHCLCGVNREAFVDQQEWLLYQHVDTEPRFVKEFVFQGDGDDEDDDDDDEQIEKTGSGDDRKRSVLTITCHAARRSNYFYWNGYCLIFLITMVSFTIYAMPTNVTAGRLQTSCTLLLTSITFRWTVNRSLPTISYLTSLDIYGIMCIVILVVHALWHGVIGALTFSYTSNYNVSPGIWLVTLDRSIFLATVGIFIIIHLALVTWLRLVPLKHRKNMQKKDAEYRLLTAQKIKHGKVLSAKKLSTASNKNIRISMGH